MRITVLLGWHPFFRDLHLAPPQCSSWRVDRGLNITGPAWHTPPVFEDGEALWTVVCDQGLEGVVAKRLDSPYRPGERGSWTKLKNKAYWRHGLKLETIRTRHERAAL